MTDTNLTSTETKPLTLEDQIVGKIEKILNLGEAYHRAISVYNAVAQTVHNATLPEETIARAKDVLAHLDHEFDSLKPLLPAFTTTAESTVTTQAVAVVETAVSAGPQAAESLAMQDVSNDVGAVINAVVGEITASQVTPESNTTDVVQVPTPDGNAAGI